MVIVLGMAYTGASVLHVMDSESLDWPTVTIAAGVITMPAWLPTLESLSEAAAAAAPILGFGLVLFKAWLSWKEHRAKLAGQPPRVDHSLFDHASTMVSRAAKHSGRLLLFGMGALGIMAALALLFQSSAKAAPVPMNQTARRSADDAGDDGDTEADATEGEPKWMVAAREELGTKEWKGKRHNPKVLAYFRDSGHSEIRNDETAWCAAFACAMLERVGVASPKNLAARSFEDWGQSVADPYPGCVAVFWRGSPNGWTGHVGFYAGETATHILVLGGNQSDGVSIAKMPRSRLLCFREPRPLRKSGTIRGAVTAAGGATVAAGGVALDVVTKTAAPIAPPLPPVLQAPAPAIEPTTLQTVSKAIEPLATYSKTIAMLAAGIAVAGALWAIYHRIKIRNETGR